MQSAITLHRPAVTAPPVPDICHHCGAVRRQREQPLEAGAWNGVVMWAVALLAYSAGIMALLWVAGTGVLGWL